MSSARRRSAGINWRSCQTRSAFRVRIITPRTELDFAGHPSIGTACALVMRQRARPSEPIRLILEENVGPVTVEVAQHDDGFNG